MQQSNGVVVVQVSSLYCSQGISLYHILIVQGKTLHLFNQRTKEDNPVSIKIATSYFFTYLKADIRCSQSQNIHPYLLRLLLSVLM